ncbi:MAG: prepilin-type N-terminal cleavage/methylation domain-containing protein [Candidatus Paceibacterota bacterium]
MKKNGFTLMELLVVIAIIGILSSIVIASMTSARQKARDTKRISDVKQLQLALALYADANSNHYPTTLGGLETIYIQKVPSGTFFYAALASVANGTPCISYHLGSTLEVTNNSALLDDSDASAGNKCSGSANDFAGTDPVFDVKP